MRPSPSRRSLLAYALAIMALAWCAATRAGEITIVLSEDSAVYREVAESIRNTLASPVSVSIADTASFSRLNRGEIRFIVAVGSKAAQAMMASGLDTPVLVTLLPRIAYEHLIQGRQGNGSLRSMSAVYLDHPLDRQLDFAHLVMPNSKRFGVLVGAESGKQLAALQAAASDRRLFIASQRVENEREIIPALQKLVPDCDVLLALPDPTVYNAGTIQPILLSTYRQRLPLIGFSASYVRAGAIASLHSTPAQIGAQAGSMLRQALAKGQLPPPRHPALYTISTNLHVARSLGIALDSEEILMQRMKALEMHN